MNPQRRTFSAARGLQLTGIMLLMATVTVGCQAEVAQPDVAYGSGPALGTWAAPIQPATVAGTSGAEAGTTGGTGVPQAGGVGGTEQAGAGGVGGTAGTAGSAGTAGIGFPGGAGGVGGTGAGGTAGTAGAGGTAGTAGASGMGGSPGLTSLTFEVLTHSQGGRYAPKNVGAIWVSTSSGAFVKTLEVWAGTRQRYLRRWQAEAGGNRVDAVSGATLRSHVAHTASWDLADANGTPAAPGDYKVIIEVTDYDGTGQSFEVPFTYGDALSLTPANATYFTGMTLSVQ